MEGIDSYRDSYKFAGDTINTRSADLVEILGSAHPTYNVIHKEGLVVLLVPAGPTHFRQPQWFISFNPADLYHPDDWFHEASSNQGHMFNQLTHGPRAVSFFAEYLRRGLES